MRTGLSPRRLTLIGVVLALTVASGALHVAGAGVATFLASVLALAGLAWLVSLATEAVGEHFGPAFTGVLQSSLGNLPELFVVFFALKAGQVVVAETSILGSLFANALLVLGVVILAGCQRAEDGIMRFRKRLPQDTSTLLFLSVFIIALLGLSAGSADPASTHAVAISAFGAVCLIGVYGVWLFRYLRDDRASAEASGEASGMGLPVAVALLTVAGVGAALVSDWFVASLDPALRALHLSQAFAGLVIVAIAGNAVENVTGVVLATKGRSDLAISVVKNSVSQIAVFLYPALVLLSLALPHHLTFVVQPVYIGAMALTALAVWQITGDGEAFAFEGWALVVTYLILAVFAYYE